MRVVGVERMYAIGDCVNFSGPKLGHMAVRQGEIAATNLASEIEGHQPVSHYDHEMRLVIDEGGGNSTYVGFASKVGSSSKQECFGSCWLV